MNPQPLDFNDTLAALHGMVGREVGVTITSERPPALIATFTGRLRQADDLPAGLPGGQAWYFLVGDDAGSGFAVPEDLFSGSDLTDYRGPEPENSLVIHLGEVAIGVEPLDERYA